MSHISAEIWHERHNIPAFIDPAHQRSSGKVVPQVIWSGIISSGEKSALPPCFGKMPLCPARWNLSAVRILKKPFTLARKTVINSTQISHIIRHNNMAIFAPLTLSDKNIACFQAFYLLRFYPAKFDYISNLAVFQAFLYDLIIFIG